MELNPDTVKSTSSADTVPDKNARAEDVTAAASDEKVTLSVIRNGDMTTRQMLEILAKDDRVLFAEPNYTTQIDTGKTAVMVPEEIKAIVSAKQSGSSPVAEPGTVVEADDITPQQWGNSEAAEYHAAGKDKEASIKVPGFGPEGSNMTGDPITVALVDSAVDFSHPDLAPVAYTFSEEDQARLGCDAHGYNATWQSAFSTPNSKNVSAI